MAIYEIGSSFGVEYEFNSFDIDGHWPPKKSDLRGWSLTRDGSCTKRGLEVDGIRLEVDRGDSLLDILPSRQVGGELVSPVYSKLTSAKFREDIQALTKLLKRYGEYLSTLTSVHVHVYMGTLPPVEVIKNILEIATRIEAPMFRLSVAELLYHRGISHNDYMYCRPLTGAGPQYVKDGNEHWRQCFDVDRIIMYANSTEEVLQAWGRADQQRSKWIPPRYYWLNPVPLLRQGTIEFRCFNQTLDFKNVEAWVHLCLAVVRAAYAKPVELDIPRFPLGKTYEDYTLEDLLAVVPMEDYTLDKLYRLWSKSDWQLGVQGPQINHLCRNQSAYVNLEAMDSRLVPPVVDREFIRSIWDNGYYD